MQKLKMQPISNYVGIGKDDPIRFYGLPLIGGMYRKRIELCLDKLSGGDRVLEIGFGSGVTFLNLDGIYKEIHGLDLASDTELIAASFRTLGIRTFLKNGNVLELPYEDGYFNSVLLVSILEHLRPEALFRAFQEIGRVLPRGGEIVYGVPVDRLFLNYAFRFLGYDIKKYHFSNQAQIAAAAKAVFNEGEISNMSVWPFGKLYQVGRFIKP